MVPGLQVCSALVWSSLPIIIREISSIPGKETGGLRRRPATVRVTHPFHPLHGREFPLVEIASTKWADLVHYTADGATLRTIRRAFTSVAAVDPFARVAAGRSAFRVSRRAPGCSTAAPSPTSALGCVVHIRLPCRSAPHDGAMESDTPRQTRASIPCGPRRPRPEITRGKRYPLRIRPERVRLGVTVRRNHRSSIAWMRRAMRLRSRSICASRARRVGRWRPKTPKSP